MSDSAKPIADWWCQGCKHYCRQVRLKQEAPQTPLCNACGEPVTKAETWRDWQRVAEAAQANVDEAIRQRDQQAQQEETEREQIADAAYMKGYGDASKQQVDRQCLVTDCINPVLEPSNMLCKQCQRIAELEQQAQQVAALKAALEATDESRDHYMALNALVGLVRLYAEGNDPLAQKLASASDIEAWVTRANQLDLATAAAKIRLREALAAISGKETPHE